MNPLLIKIIDSPLLLAKFLNTLSLLEYIGARKILKSQHQETMPEKILDHAAEELRHAQILKRAAKKLAPELCDTYAQSALLAGQQAQDYLQAVDRAAVTLGIQNPWHNYLCTTWLIEKRALQFYGLFEEVLLQMEKPSIFRGILYEEKNHLQEIEQWLENLASFPPIRQSLQTLEAVEFGHFMQAVAEQCPFAADYIFSDQEMSWK